ncbi:MAG: histidine kinase [Gemmatimonadaceae bacterium]|nr:histidine kinase [Gemmatimonadaceae bacterium]
MTPRAPSHTPRPPLRFVLVVAALLCAAYISVFLAGGLPMSLYVGVDALANTAALALMALGVRWVTDQVPWSYAPKWWFLPLHVLAGLVAAQMSLAFTAIALGVASLTRNGGLTVTWLVGPARHWQLFTFVFAYAAVAGSCYALQVMAEARDARVLRQDAELARLRERLDPHVLLNTLHSLLEMVRGNDPGAEEAIERYGRVVRYVTAPREGVDDLVPLRDEWAHLEDYLHLEQLRLGDRLRVVLDVAPTALAVRVPALSLQPLVENAIVHGIAPRPGAGSVTVQATREARAVSIMIEDDGVGTQAPATPGSGRALQLIRSRLRLHFGAQADMQWGAGPGGCGWRVTLRVPA